MSESLRERCKRFYSQQQRSAMMRTGDPVQELMEFIIAETGRKAEPALDEALPLCLYFASKADRADFIAMVQQNNPGMTARTVV